MTTFRILSLLLVSIITFAQSNYPPYAYRSNQNPFYWKNKRPHESYWQQDVHYKIKATLDDKTDIVTATEELTYYNNSPHVLDHVFFQLYNNAQVKNSYLSDLYTNNNLKPSYGPYQKNELGISIASIKTNEAELKIEKENTIAKVLLQKPLLPGDSITFKIEFKTYFDSGTIRNRMKMYKSFGYKHYDLVHWYPRISVYDAKFGWFTDQHMDHEFYGDFGTYETEITFPNNYIVDATGVLMNSSEVLPTDLRSKLDLKNFKNKPLGADPSEIVKPDGTTKTWKYIAINVHDFALTADPTYRIGEAETNAGVKCYSFVQESHATGWQYAAEYAAKLIEVYSKNFGPYIYPKITVADANDGMEYPMLTLDKGTDPDHRDLLAHEIGHNWFFGMIGNNETYRSGMDEGFTQFAQNFAYEQIDGLYRKRTESASRYVNKFLKPDLIRNTEVYNRYITEAAKGDQTILNTHSDGFNGAIRHGGGFSQNYYKCATMLYNLQYVLGDSLFLAAMNHYVEQWKIAHPYFEDFKASIINYTHADLNWFFDQWWDTPKTIDYAVKKVNDGTKAGEYTITFERKGRMQMPIDFTVTGKSGKSYNYYIPNTFFEKKTNATTLARWIGWDKTRTTYIATVQIPEALDNVRIDTTNRLADINMLNNSYEFPLSITFDSKITNPIDRTKYELFYRPDLWYNGYDGLKAGVALNGSYLKLVHVFDLNLWYNSGLGQNFLKSESSKNKFDAFSYRINYRTTTNSFTKNSAISIGSRFLDGLHNHSISFEKNDEAQKNKFYIKAKTMWRPNQNSMHYLLLPNKWDERMSNNTITLGYEHLYNYKNGTGNIQMALRSTTLRSDYNYAYATLQAVNKNTVWRFNVNTRMFMQYGTGNNWAPESQLYLAGANPEELMENKFTRSQGFFTPDWATIGATTNHFQYGGGLNLRGYAGYLAPETDINGDLVHSYNGSTGAAFNMEIEFDRLITLMPRFLRNTFKINTYLFTDAGTIKVRGYRNEFKLADIRVDAGLGTALTIKKWGPLQAVDPLTIRFDMPFFLNRAPYLEDNFQFRWILSISRAF